MKPAIMRIRTAMTPAATPIPILAPVGKESELATAGAEVSFDMMRVLVDVDWTRSDDCHIIITGQTCRLAVRLVYVLISGDADTSYVQV